MAAASGAGVQEAWDFSASEDRDGLRFSWNEWPSSRTEAAANVVPLGALYTPLRPVDGMPPALKYEPIKCLNYKCYAVLNPYCRVDYQHKIWACPFCATHNHFPYHYAYHISETNLPAELISDYTTVEYEIPGKKFGAPTFLFVVDTCVCEDDELDEIKDSIRQAMDTLIPEDANVGLITFGQHVQVYDLSTDVMARSVVLKGDKPYEPQQVQELLGVLRPGSAAGAAAPTESGPTSNARRFLGRAGDTESAMEVALDDMCVDLWPTEKDCRPNRCLGNALHIAVSLLEGGLHQSAGRIMMFLSGPTTIGPGKIVDPDLRNTLRSHTDLAKDNDAAKYHDSSREYFGQIAQRCTNASLQVDVFACALDQVGLFEMRECIENTGGLCVVGDEFKQSIFKESFRRVFTKHEEDMAPEGDAGFMMAGGGAMLEVQTSPDYKVCGAIGHCVSLKKTGPSVSDTEIGEGGTYVWALSGVHPTTTVALYFEVSRQEPAAISPDRYRYIQLVTRYQHASGSYRMRVTTSGGAWCANPAMKQSLVAGFDQEAAAVLLARIALLRTAEEEADDILRWLDVSLIKLCSTFASYKPDETAGFQLPDTMSIFPQFMFHFRRSVFMQTFNSSPDDSAYKKLTFMREDCANSLVMIQASLLCYSFAGPPAPVLLDAESVRPDVVLLLDTFFTVVIWQGDTIAQWRKEGYQERPEHAAFKALLQAPQDDAQQIMEDRIPVPRYIVCDEGQSQERFLLAKVNPSKPRASHDGVASKEVITDDVSFSVFMEHLIKLAVTPS